MTVKEGGIPSKIRNATRVSGPPTYTEFCARSAGQCNKAREKKKKSTLVWKEETQQYLFMVLGLYLGDLMEPTKMVLDLISEFIRVPGDKISIKIKCHSPF